MSVNSQGCACRPLYFSTPGMVYHQMITFLDKIGVPSVSRWIVEYSPSKTIQDLRSVTRVLHDTSADIIRRKKAALENGELGHGDGKDIMSVLRTCPPILRLRPI